MQLLGVLTNKIYEKYPISVSGRAIGHRLSFNQFFNSDDISLKDVKDDS